MEKYLMFICILIFQLSDLFSQAGALDLTFGSGGMVTTNLGSTDQGHDVVFQADGKMVIAGQKGWSFNADAALIRYNPDGSLDNTFGVGGYVVVDVSNNYDILYSVAIQADGKIVAAGYSMPGTTALDFLVMRFNTDGSLDNSFDSDGIVTVDIYGLDTTDQSDNNDIASTIALQSDGKIVVGGGSSDENSDRDFCLMRFNEDGSLDNSFDSDGIVITTMGIGIDEIKEIAIQQDGKILAAGFGSYSIGVNSIALARYNPDGSLDNSFDSDGKVNTLIGSNTNGSSVFIQGDHKILVGGSSYNGSTLDFMLVRYNVDGSMDNSFDLDGIVVTAIGLGSDEANSIAMQPDGKILVGGYIGYNNIPANVDFAVVRYNMDGSLDNLFDTDGKVTTSIGSSYAVGYSLAVQPDNRIVLAGWSDMGANSDDIAIARYLNDANSGLLENKNSTFINIYPNPTSDIIQLESKVDASVVIHDVLGNIVYQGSLIKFEEEKIDLSTCTSGLYFVNVYVDHQFFSSKIVKQ